MVFHIWDTGPGLAGKLRILIPIKNLWRIAKKMMAACRPTTLDQLMVSIKQAWSSITPADCQRLVESIPRRVQAVIAANEGPTKY